MRRSFYILIGGAIILAVGIGVVGVTSASIEAKYPSTTIIMEGVRIVPGESSTVEVSLIKVEQLFLGVTGIPREESMMVHVERVVDQQKILEVAFSASLIKDIGPLEEGDYIISVTNLGTESVVVYTALTTEPILDEFEQLTASAFSIIAGLLLMIIGVVTVIGGGIVYFIEAQKKKQKNP